MPTEKPVGKKIQVSFSDRQIELLEKLKGEFGETDADVVRGIVISWLAEKSFISAVAKQRMNLEHSTADAAGADHD